VKAAVARSGTAEEAGDDPARDPADDAARASRASRATAPLQKR
jgi:hypothetical protein